jgi:hypothetical protein
MIGRGAPLAIAACLLAGAQAFAQTPPAAAPPAALPVPGESAKSVTGTWEISNADRDRSCTLTLKPGAGAGALALEWDRKCAEVFPYTRDIRAWRVGARESIELLDAKGQVALELTEVEGGLYEGERPGEGLVFLQSVAASGAEERKPEELAGEWGFTRGAGKPICQVTLATSAAAQDAFALQVKPGCDALITRFGPVAWRLDRSQLVLIPARGEAWRFEESDPSTWKRIPEARQPLQLVRQ